MKHEFRTTIMIPGDPVKMMKQHSRLLADWLNRQGLDPLRIEQSEPVDGVITSTVWTEDETAAA